MAITESEIYGRVRSVLVGSLGVEEEQVTPHARLTDDLGAESIDYLDITFQTEKAFGIRIDRNEMLMGDFLADPYVEDGRITDAGIAELRNRLPYLDLELLERSRDIRDVRRAFTVDTLVQFVKAKLDGRQ